MIKGSDCVLNLFALMKFESGNFEYNSLENNCIRDDLIHVVAHLRECCEIWGGGVIY